MNNFCFCFFSCKIDIKYPFTLDQVYIIHYVQLLLCRQQQKLLTKLLHQKYIGWYRILLFFTLYDVRKLSYYHFIKKKNITKWNLHNKYPKYQKVIFLVKKRFKRYFERFLIKKRTDSDLLWWIQLTRI